VCWVQYRDLVPRETPRVQRDAHEAASYKHRGGGKEKDKLGLSRERQEEKGREETKGNRETKPCEYRNNLGNGEE
jgi:hypothetical protein